MILKHKDTDKKEMGLREERKRRRKLNSESERKIEANCTKS